MGRPKRTSQQIQDYLLSHSRITASGCWQWIGCVMKGKGCDYGAMRAFGENYAPRVSWIIHNGPIPKGLRVLHECDNPLCVNPHHLFLGTNKDNSEDMVRKCRQHKKLTDEQVALLRKAHARALKTSRSDRAACRAVATEFGVHPGYVRMLHLNRRRTCLQKPKKKKQKTEDE